MNRYRYTIEAYDNIKKISSDHINIVEVVMFAQDESSAISEAKKLIKKEEYSITKIEVIRVDEHEYQIR